MQPLIDFLGNPLVAPLWGILVLALIDLALGVYRSVQQGQFDWAKLPQTLDSVVLARILPLAAMGVAAYLMTDPNTKAALIAAYGALSATVLAAQVKALLDKLTGTYTATDAKGSVLLTPMYVGTVSGPDATVLPPVAPNGR